MASDNTYIEELTQCDGSDSTIVGSLSCTVALSVFKLAPFNLYQGDHIKTKVSAINDYGESVYSQIGNGAVVLSLPDAPHSLSNDATVTGATQIKITWSPGFTNGGSPVIDYQVYYTLELEVFSTPVEGVLTEYYTTTDLLQAGSNYKFKVTSRTAVGYSTDSDQIVVMAARVPDAPTILESIINNGLAELVWSAPDNGGSPITAYSVNIRTSDGLTYIEDTVNCDGSSSTIVAEATCSVPTSVLLSAPFNL